MTRAEIVVNELIDKAISLTLVDKREATVVDVTVLAVPASTAMRLAVKDRLDWADWADW